MTYSYSNQLNYGPQQVPLQYEGMTYQKPSLVPMTLGGAAIGGIAGAGYGAYKNNNINNFISKEGEVTDTFAKTTFEKYINHSAKEGKEAYNGGLNILNKIDSIKNPEELKQLFDANKEAADDICKELKQKPEDFIKNITNKNLEANKKVIKEKINATNNTRYQNIKNQIQACWNSEKNKFVKNNSVPDEIFNIIKKTSSGTNWKILGKCAAIGSAIAAVATYISGKLLIK